MGLMYQNAQIVDFEANIALIKGCILTVQAPYVRVIV